MSLEHYSRRAALGFEYQILDYDLHPDGGKGPNRTAAALYDLVDVDSAKILRPVGEFNDGRILLMGGHGEHWLNGKKVLEYDLDSASFRAQVSASKHGDLPGYAAQRTGHIVLQDHGDDVWFRGIRIRRPSR